MKLLVEYMRCEDRTFKLSFSEYDVTGVVCPRHIVESGAKHIEGACDFFRRHVETVLPVQVVGFTFLRRAVGKEKIGLFSCDVQIHRASARE